MAIKWRQMLDAGKNLSKNPFSFKDQLKLLESRQDWRVIEWGYERMIDGLSTHQVEHLRKLTFIDPDLDWLETLPIGTFGREYADFFRSENVSASGYMDAWPAMQRVVEKSWIARRSLKLHDMHHLLMGFNCDPFGELGVTAFTARNNRDPNNVIVIMGLPFVAIMYGDLPRVWRSTWEGWRLAGVVRENLFHMPLEEMYELSIEEVRRRCGIPRISETCPLREPTRRQRAAVAQA